MANEPLKGECFVEVTELRARKIGHLFNRHISTMGETKEEVEAWKVDRNNNKSKIYWQFTNKQVRVKIKRIYLSIFD